jgi:hypothetical protein
MAEGNKSEQRFKIPAVFVAAKIDAGDDADQAL